MTKLPRQLQLRAVCKVSKLPLNAKICSSTYKIAAIILSKVFFSDEVFQFQHLPVQGLLYFEFFCFYISVHYPAICMATDNNEI